MTVFVGLSGGVDSLVSAWILKNDGYDVVGIHAILVKELEESILGKIKDVLGIEILKVDLRKEFEEKIIRFFIDEYSRGRTPNPCALCNKEIKFHLLMDFAMKMGADMFATGHYVKLVRSNMGLILAKGRDEKKDQSYFLSLIERERLKNLIFPLGEYKKDDVVKMAEGIGFKVDELKSSKDLCFVHGNYRELLERYGFTGKAGIFVDENGKILGRHDGIHRYTVGQRKGLKISAGKPLYVKRIDEDGTITLVTKDGMFSKSFSVGEINWFMDVTYPVKCSCKVRYRTKEVDAVVERYDERFCKVSLMEPAFAITPGQISAFYDGDLLLGGAVIEEVLEDEEHTSR